MGSNRFILPEIADVLELAKWESLKSGGALALRPFKVCRPYDTTSDQLLSLSADDEGVVLYTKTDSRGQEFHYVDIPRKSVKGWVPSVCVDVNWNAHYGDVSLRCSVDSLGLSMHNFLDEATMATPFVQAMLIELSQWHLNQQELELGMHASNLINTEEKRCAIVNAVVKGCRKAGTLDTINNPNFTWKTLSEASTASKTDNHGGIYGSRYSNFKNNPGKRDVARIGSAAVVMRRVKQHTERTEDRTYYKERTHYNEAREARNCVHFTICELDSSNIMFIVEQLFIGLFELFSPKLWVSSEENDDAKDHSDLCDTGDVHVDDASDKSDANDTNDKRDDEDAHAERWFNYKRYAPKIRKYGKLAKEQARWHGGASREEFGVAYGVNVSSPLFERKLFAPVQWVRSDIPGKCAIFTRAGTRVAGRPANEVMVLHFKGHNFYMSTKYAAYPKPDTYTYVQVEIMLDGSRHPHPYANCPDIPIWSDYGEANTVGISACWKDELGCWHKAPLMYRSRDPHTNQKEDDRYVRGAHRGYVRALAYKRYLMHEILDNPSEWDKEIDFGYAVVYKAEFDAFAQEIVVTLMPTCPKLVQKGTLATEKEVSDLLRAVGARFARTIASESELPLMLELCDWCKADGAVGTGVNRKCRQLNSGKWMKCTECNKRGLICTWTRQPAEGDTIDNDTPVDQRVAKYIVGEAYPDGDHYDVDPYIMTCTLSGAT